MNHGPRPLYPLLFYSHNNRSNRDSHHHHNSRSSNHHPPQSNCLVARTWGGAVNHGQVAGQHTVVVLGSVFSLVDRDKKRQAWAPQLVRSKQTFN